MAAEKNIKDLALKYLMYMSRSAYELEVYLKSKGFEETEIGETLDFLKELHYIDDEKYCKSYTKNQIAKGKGPIRLRNELKEKGISQDYIDIALEEYYDGENQKENAMKQAIKSLGDKYLNEEEGRQALEEKDLAKIGRRLSYLGYSSSVIYYVIGKLKKL